MGGRKPERAEAPASPDCGIITSTRRQTQTRIFPPAASKIKKSFLGAETSDDFHYDIGHAAEISGG